MRRIDLGVNPSDETIRLGPLVVRILITGENSSGSIAAFEVTVPAGQRIATTIMRRPSMALMER
jgi:hypothetical protein